MRSKQRKVKKNMCMLKQLRTCICLRLWLPLITYMSISGFDLISSMFSSHMITQVNYLTFLPNYNVYLSYYVSHGTNKDYLYPKPK